MIKCKILQLLVAFLLILPCLAYALPGSHDPDTGAGGIACNSCHIAPNTIGNTEAREWTNVCYKCHKLTGNFQFSVNDFADIDAVSTLPTRNAPKNTSHKWLGSDINNRAKAKAAVDNTAGGLNKKGLSGTLSCVRCHSVHGTSGATSTVSPYPRYPNDKDEMCNNCHADRANSTASAGSHPIGVSYTSARVKAKTGQFIYSGANRNPYRNVANPTAEMKNKKGFVVCTSCHGVHVADSDSSTFDTFSSANKGHLNTSDGSLLRVSKRGANNAQTTINICTNCHIKNHSGQAKQHGMTDLNAAGGGQIAIQCTDCHGAHVDTTDPLNATPNKYLLRRFVNYSGVKGDIKQLDTYRKRLVYTSYTTVSGVSTAKWSDSFGTGVCQACHALPASISNHLNTGATRRDCIVCHANAPHTDNQPSANCNSCHGYPPTSGSGANGPATHNGVTYARYNESATPHVSHAGASGSNYNYACSECHSGNTHNSGSFTDVFVSPSVKAGASATYTAAVTASASTPAGDSTCNNVYCHSDGTGSFKSGQSAIVWSGTSKIGSIIGQPTECATCHDDKSALVTGSHARHVATTAGNMAYTCNICHAATVSDNTTITDKNYHVNGDKDVVFSGSGAASGSYVSAAKTCASVVCHSNGKSAAPVITPVWGTASTGACNACHLTDSSTPQLTSGGHVVHFAGTTNASTCSKCHTYTTVTAATHVNGSLQVNTAETGCGAIACHGYIEPPTWTVSLSTYNSCTKCHGTPTVTVTSDNRYVIAPNDPTATDTGKVSTNPGTGAHQTHMRYLNGFSNYSTYDYRCLSCHPSLPASVNHSTGVPETAFANIASKWGAVSGATFGGGNCSNVYCHKPAGTTLTDVGTDPNPSWTDASYIENGGKSLNNCKKCHAVPGDGVFSKQAVHGTMVTDSSANQCNACHGHNGDSTGVVGQRHIDGILYVNGTCDSCHGYPPMSQADYDSRAGGYVNAKVETVGGGGHHKLHLSSTVVATDGFTPCLPCHPNSTLGLHQQGGANVYSANVNVFYAADTDYRFDSQRTKRYNRSSRTCSNISCHFQPTPAW